MHTDYAKIILAIADSLRAAAAAEPLPPVPPLAEPLPPVLSEQVQKDAAEQVRNAVVVRDDSQQPIGVVGNGYRIDFDAMADNLKDTIDEGAVVDAAAEQIAGQICFDKVVAAAAQKLAEQIMARLLRA